MIINDNSHSSADLKKFNNAKCIQLTPQQAAYQVSNWLNDIITGTYQLKEVDRGGDGVNLLFVSSRPGLTRSPHCRCKSSRAAGRVAGAAPLRSSAASRDLSG